MKLHVLIIIGFTLSLMACENKEQAAPEQAAEATATAPAEKESYQYDGIIEHMHRHADQIDIINDALADGDLDASKVPARWLWRHETMIDVPDDWQPYLFAMRQAARDLGSATDIATARAAATRITEQCQGCHVAAGVMTNGVEQEDE